MGTHTLNEQLSELTKQIKAKAPAEIFGTYAEERQILDATADRSSFVKAGDTVRPLTLLDATGAAVDLSGLWAAGPAVIVFYRGAWCPYCNLALRTYQIEVLPELDKLGGKLVAISPQVPDGSLSAKETSELTFTVLSDVGNELARSLGITHISSDKVRAAGLSHGNDLGKVNGTGEWELPHPTVLIVDRGGTVVFADVRVDYTTRTDPAEILAALRTLA